MGGTWVKLVESPRERVKAVTLDLLTDRSLPNILLGMFLTSFIQWLVGMVPFAFMALSFLAWQASVFVYAVADEVREKIEEAKNRLLDPEDVSEFYGIE